MPDDTFDLDGFEDAENEASSEDSGESDPFKKLRAHSRKLERQLREQKKELEDLRAFRVNRETEVRTNSISETLKGLGLPEKHAELFNAVRKDVEPTEAAVKAFAEEYGLLIAGEDGSTEETGGFAPTPPAGSPAAQKRLTSAEWHSLYKENPDAAFKALRENRVDLQSTL